MQQGDKSERGWAARFNLWFWVLVAAVFLLSGLAMAKGVSSVVTAQDELQAILEVNQRLKAQNEALYQKVLRIKQDPKAIEKACRSDLDLIGPGEVVYLEPGEASSSLPNSGALGGPPVVH